MWWCDELTCSLTWSLWTLARHWVERGVSGTVPVYCFAWAIESKTQFDFLQSWRHDLESIKPQNIINIERYVSYQQWTSEWVRYTPRHHTGQWMVQKNARADFIVDNVEFSYYSLNVVYLQFRPVSNSDSLSLIH